MGGVSLDALADRFDVSRDSIHRHFRAHVSEARRAELMAGPAKMADLANAARLHDFRAERRRNAAHHRRRNKAVDNNGLRYGAMEGALARVCPPPP